MTTDLIPSVSIENLLQQRDAIVERATAAHQKLVEIRDIAEAAFAGCMGTYFQHEIELHQGNYRQRHFREFTDPDGSGLAEYVKTVDAWFWQYLFSKSGNASFMDAEALKAWNEQVDRRDFPPLTVENITSTFAGLHASRKTMFERGVVAVFRALSWDYKTNNPVKFGRRQVLRYVCGPWAWQYGPQSEQTAKLDDLLRVLHVLDGKPEPAPNRRAYHLLSEQRWPRENQVGDLGYFTVRGFKNGNGHLTFKREDLVDKLNLIVARHYPSALPPSREAEKAWRAA